MADEVIEASVWGVNERGEIVAATGSGTSNVAGYISESQIPQNEQGKVVFANVATLVKDASGNVVGIQGASGLASGFPMTRSQCGIPRILPPSGTIGNNGALTLGTALPYTVFPLSCYMYFAGFGGTASFATNVMTVTGAAAGNLVVGSVISAAGVPAGTTITSFGTGLGGVGTYNLSTTPGTIAALPIAASVLGRDASNAVPVDGMYYTVLSSGATGTVYNNRYDPTTGIAPTVPASPTSFATTGSGVGYTQVISTSPNSAIKLGGYTVKGGTLGSNGGVTFRFLRNWMNNANNKGFKIGIGSVIIASGNDTTGAGVTTNHTFWNLGSQVANVIVGSGLGDGAGSSAQNFLNYDTSLDLTFTYQYQLTAATDWAAINASGVTATPFM